MDPNLTMKVIDTMVDVKENASSPFVLDMKIGRENDLFVLTNHSVSYFWIYLFFILGYLSFIMK